MKIAEVVLPLPIEKSFSYSVPGDLERRIQVGMRVEVSFGNRSAMGFVIGITTLHSPQVSGRSLKEITEIVDREPVVSPEILKLCRWVSSYYLCPLGKVLHTAVPIGKSSGFQVPSSKFRVPNSVTEDRTPGPAGFFLPTVEQKQALELIQDYIDHRKYGVVLLEGPRNSGKTEVWLQAVAHTLDLGRKTLILVPEIAITSGLLEKFRNRFSTKKVAVFHSGLKSREHDSLWEKIRRGDIDVVIGTRSAVFCPVETPGLIVIDSEGDPSFKEEKEPRYNAREVAMARARICNALLILESGTPSVETYYNALKGKYERCRFQTLPGFEFRPKIEVVDRKKKEGEQYSQKTRIFSSVLFEAMKSALGKKERVFLFLNRRGFASLFLCKDCEKVIYCPECDVPLSFHRSSGDQSEPGFLLCHRCNYRMSVPRSCPHCGSINMKHYGVGTQQVLEEVKRLFPDARVGRLDTDVVREKKSWQRILKDFRQGRIDVLVGTQMAAGENISGIFLLGVVLADGMLGIPDFRSAERTFRVLSGLMENLKPGKDAEMPSAVIQAYSPEHYVFQALQQGGFAAFFREEIKFRRRLKYPPFSRLANIIISDSKESRCAELAEEIARVLREEKKGGKVDVLGPVPAPVAKLRGKYRYEIMLKGRKKNIERAISAVRAQSLRPEKISVDIDPITMV